MSPPDATVLCQSLTTTTSLVLTSHEEVKFRAFMLRSMLKVDAQPTTAAVLEYQQTCQRWCCRATPARKMCRVNSKAHRARRVIRVRRSSTKCSLQLAPLGCLLRSGEIPSRERSLQKLASVFQTALQVVRAAQHSPHMSGPQASPLSSISSGGRASVSACAACLTDFTGTPRGSARHQPSISRTFRHSSV